VRIALDPEEVKAHPLRVGLSMQATVDISSTEGAALADGRTPSTAYTTTALDHSGEEADKLVAATIAQNLGNASNQKGADAKTGSQRAPATALSAKPAPAQAGTL
jgi:membrane fusion protein (multidrug efflux system)